MTAEQTEFADTMAKNGWVRTIELDGDLVCVTFERHGGRLVAACMPSAAEAERVIEDWLNNAAAVQPVRS